MLHDGGVDRGGLGREKSPRAAASEEVSGPRARRTDDESRDRPRCRRSGTNESLLVRRRDRPQVRARDDRLGIRRDAGGADHRAPVGAPRGEPGPGVHLVRPPPPAPTNAVIFAFAGNAIFAAIYSDAAPVQDADVVGQPSKLHLWGGSSSSLARAHAPLGITQGKEYAELGGRSTCSRSCGWASSAATSS